MQTTDKQIYAAISMLRGFFHYLGWWCFAGLLGGASAPVFADNKTEAFHGFVYNLVGGIAIGVVMALAFTLFQNKYNPTRKKQITVAVAVGLWLIVRYAGIRFFLEQE